MNAKNINRLQQAAYRHGEIPWSLKSIRQFLSLQDAICVHSSNAFALGRIAVDDVELLAMAVDPNVQNQGLGSRTLDKFLDACRQKMTERVILEVAQSNFAAQRLYTKFGFDIVGRRKAYYRSANNGPQDALVLCKVFDSNQ